MANHDEREKLERELVHATGAARERIRRLLEKLAGRRGADTRPRGKDAETR